MKDPGSWRPSKFVYRRGKLIASRDTDEVAVGSRLMVDRVARCYDATLSQHATGLLVDLGCGTVPLYRAYADLVTDVVCVDLGGTSHARHLDVECDLNGPLPFPDQTFDTIVLSDVLEHIARPETLWAEMARILAPGGEILMNVPFLYWIHASPHDYYRYTESALRRFVESAGLELIRLDALGGAPEVVADIVAKNFAAVPLIGRPVATLVQWMTEGITATRIGGKISRVTSVSFPLGYFLIARKNPVTSSD
jgi:SAM-dependent methyltransferase